MDAGWHSPDHASVFRRINRYWLADGRAEQLVPAKLEEGFVKAYPRLSADGQTLFYAEGSVSGAGAKLIRHDLTSGKAVPYRHLSQAYDLAPDGKHLVIPFFDGASKIPTIRIITKDGQPVRDLVRLKPEERVRGLTWSPDGNGSTSDSAPRPRLSYAESSKWGSGYGYGSAYVHVVGFCCPPQRDTYGFPEAAATRDVARGRHPSGPGAPRAEAMNRILRGGGRARDRTCTRRFAAARRP